MPKILQKLPNSCHSSFYWKVMHFNGAINLVAFKFWPLLLENLPPITFKNRPIWSHWLYLLPSLGTTQMFKIHILSFLLFFFLLSQSLAYSRHVSLEWKILTENGFSLSCSCSFVPPKWNNIKQRKSPNAGALV